MDTPLSPTSSTAATTPLPPAGISPTDRPLKQTRSPAPLSPHENNGQSASIPQAQATKLVPPTPPQPPIPHISLHPATVPASSSPSSIIPPSTQSPLPEPSKSIKPHRHCLTRDQRRDILLMRSLGHTYHQICKHLNVPFGAVQYTCQKRSASPKRRPGRARRLTDEKLDEIETFITSSIQNRQMTYQEVVNALGLDVKEDTLTQALRKRGLVRQMAFLRSPLAVGNVTAKPIRTYLTCRKNEEIDSPLVVEVIKRKTG
ncbi:hypothetical protein CPC735_007630 [Coccidioides posadasii C735 delta SOWgp]|uniref:Transposase Tc1-like domain-containing protein n=3 Tax=Coccidioides posadasii TaxID=199306 RepID=E9CXG7_COCPS|nr:hypothetical protein CPC735_007630 [Coccidioides posadasii C735 delta SOWgp]EER26590.1 hypothetical protein CPC735_007630 [Coccidioides posadasii C735 delta SOWgp]EFW20644.1 conserved hypothetical protein [Coccidioides posadasii str. Silveira]KMM72794.1 hypothetical protein CPAG_09086 [Coccidioides posadasii RMSCC 3488]|eukprot:XP_003068735.1 hypothetical protein CPC735_007630 [Coccidioides posadasii C735 delta SOWgp]